MNDQRNTKRSNPQRILQLLISLAIGLCAGITTAQSDNNLELKDEVKLFINAVE